MSAPTRVPAFPTNATDGMSLRDYFAAKALTAMLASSERFEMENGKFAITPQHFANAAYGMADAMIAARSE
jgi:hypothetical protein